jgi:hypothetical protein
MKMTVLYLEVGGNRLLLDIDVFIPDYTASDASRQ